MVRAVLVFVCLLAVYVVVHATLDGLDAPLWADALATAALLALPCLYCSVLAPRRARASLLKAVDPEAGPPPGAVAADSALIAHLDLLLQTRDYDAFRSHLSQDFGHIVGRWQFGAGSYVRSLKAYDRQAPGTRRTEAVLEHPDEPDVLWVRSRDARKPRFGAPYVATTWTRITLTPEGTRVREVESAGVSQVA